MGVDKETRTKVIRTKVIKTMVVETKSNVMETKVTRIKVIKTKVRGTKITKTAIKVVVEDTRERIPEGENTTHPRWGSTLLPTPQDKTKVYKT